MPSFACTLPVAATLDALWTLVRDIRRVAGLFTYTEIEDFTTLGPDCWEFDRSLRIPSLTELHWRERAQVTAPNTLQFQAVAGDLQTFQGCWRVTPAGDTAQLSLELEYEIPRDVGPPVPEALAQYVMSELFRTICKRVKEAAEEGGG